MSRSNKYWGNKVHKIIIIIFLTVFLSNFSLGKSQVDNLRTIESIDNIPIFSRIYIKQRDSSDFDSKQGKILILNFELKQKYESEMLNFYKNFFKNTDWILLKINGNLIHFENKRKHNNKKFIIRRNSNNFWNLNYIVENF